MPNSLVQVQSEQTSNTTNARSTSANLLIPSNRQLIGNVIADSSMQLSRNNMGIQAHAPFIMTLFGVIVIANLISNIPFGYSVASSISFSLGLSVAIFIACCSIAITVKGISWLADFVPATAPAVLQPVLAVIELISYMARSVSLGIRLFANLVAGHTLLGIISAMTKKVLLGSWIGPIVLAIPLALLMALIGLELAVAVIQGYVFSVLTSIYVSEASSKAAH